MSVYAVLCLMYVLYHVYVSSPLLTNAAYCITYQGYLLYLYAMPVLHPCAFPEISLWIT